MTRPIKVRWQNKPRPTKSLVRGSLQEPRFFWARFTAVRRNPTGADPKIIIDNRYRPASALRVFGKRKARASGLVYASRQSPGRSAALRLDRSEREINSACGSRRDAETRRKRRPQGQIGSRSADFQRNNSRFMLTIFRRTRALVTCFILGSVAALHAAATASKPNIIFVLSDDLAQGDVGCYGQKLIQTPNLDRMAREGTRYTQAYCGTTVCAPSRTSLMIGQHTGHSPIRANREIQPEGQMPLPAGTFTVAQAAEERRLRDRVHRQVGHGHVRHHAAAR